MIKLQPLRIPAGWNIIQNNFTDIDVTQFDSDDEIWLGMVQDIAMISRLVGKETKITIDLGWYPDNAPNGEYHLQVIKNTDWEQPLEEFCSRDYRMITDKMEEFFKIYCYKR